MTSVIFRIDKTGDFKGSLTAVFVDHQGTSDPSTKECYAHLGQHSTCSMEWVLQDTRPAHPEEYSSLLKELISIGYDDLKILTDLRGVR